MNIEKLASEDVQCVHDFLGKEGGLKIVGQPSRNGEQCTVRSQAVPAFRQLHIKKLVLEVIPNYFIMETLKSTMAPSSPMSSVPLKKRSPETVLQDEKEEVAAAALAALSSSPKASTTSGLDLSKPREDPSGNISDSEESYSSQNNVLPKAVHAPPLNNMMVDHTYTDYSVVKESSLAFLEEGEEPTSKMSEEERKKYTRRIAKVKKIFGEVVPSKKNSGGVVKPFPEKVSRWTFFTPCFVILYRVFTPSALS